MCLTRGGHVTQQRVPAYHGPLVFGWRTAREWPLAWHLVMRKGHPPAVGASIPPLTHTALGRAFCEYSRGVCVRAEALDL